MSRSNTVKAKAYDEQNQRNDKDGAIAHQPNENSQVLLACNN
jgi:hypothetical protein